MINIKEIYLGLNMSDSAPPHYFEIENIATMFIPSDKQPLADAIHLIPEQQNISPTKKDALLALGQHIIPPYESLRLLLSHNDQAIVRFHILSAAPEDETKTAHQVLQRLVEEMEPLT